MTVRLYYDDAYTRSFAATVVERFTQDNQPAVVLDQTHFYPTSGGQPHDTGWLMAGDQRLAVVDVVDGPEKQSVIHLLSEAPATDQIVGHIEWPRRFDHMQHHTGQHILSQAFIRVAGAETVGFHLSDQTVTIDLDRAGISDGDVASAELLVNEIIWENRPVTSRQISTAEAEQLALRKIPPGLKGTIRVVDVSQFDRTACGGTHVAHTGEIGQLKVVRTENRREGTRVTFCCGRRALAEHERKSVVVAELTASLTTGLDELVDAVERLQLENKESRSLLKKQMAAILAHEARSLLSSAEIIGEDRIVTAVMEDGTTDELGQLGRLLSDEPHVVALLGLSGERASLLFSRSPNARGSMQALLATALQTMENGRGGGNDLLARGGSQHAGNAEIQLALETAVRMLRAHANELE